MAKIALLNVKGDKLKDINLNDNIWNIEPNDAVLHNALILSLASLRQGTHKTKNRSEVSGGGRKPWRQKGTGRARQGSIRATQWRGGGIVFGPTPRDYKKKMNKKERRLALLSALSYKFKGKELMVVDNMNLETPKTKDFTELLNNLKLDDKKVLIVTSELEDNLILASRNLSQVLVLSNEEINTLDIFNADYMVVTEDAVNKIEEVLS